MKMFTRMILIIIMALCSLNGCSVDTTRIQKATPDEIVPVTTTSEAAETTVSTNYTDETVPAATGTEDSTTPTVSSATETESEEGTTEPVKKTTSSNGTVSNKYNNTNTNNNQNKTVAVTGVKLSKTSITITEGKSSSFTVTITPSNATNTNFTVSTSNNNASVSCSGSTVKVTGKSAGSCTVTVTTNNGKTAKCSVTVKKKEVAQVTDDTPLSHYELYTDANMNKVTNVLIEHFKKIGMVYTPSLNINNTGWMFAHQGSTIPIFTPRSVNQETEDILICITEQVDAVLLSEHLYSDGHTSYYYTPDPSDICFNCYYVRRSEGIYNIYFCYG